MKNKILLAVLLSFGVIFLSGFGCKQEPKKTYSLNLEIWGLFDGPDAFDEIFDAYKEINPNISEITYRKMNQDTFQQDLIKAMAAGQGPDIFLVHNRWIPSFTANIYPAPAEILSEQKMRNDFVDVVVNDFVVDGGVYASPLNVDTMALYYNKDLFNVAGVTNPPKDWNEFMDIARKLTKFDDNGQIVQSGAAMGTAFNINRAADILNLLMLQKKTEMVDAGKIRAIFNNRTGSGVNMSSPGEDAFNFYAQFADQNSTTAPYTWNSRLHNSIDAFSEGTLGMMLNYSWQMDALSFKSPKLNYAVAPVPQFSEEKVNVANYWGFTVAKNRTPSIPTNAKEGSVPVTNDLRAEESWKLIAFMTTKADQNVVVTKEVAGRKQVVSSDFDAAAKYAEKTNKPAARRDLIEKQKGDPKIGIFAQENLIAKSWYQIDSDAIEALFVQAIEKVNRGEFSTKEALDFVASNVNMMMSAKKR